MDRALRRWRNSQIKKEIQKDIDKALKRDADRVKVGGWAFYAGEKGRTRLTRHHLRNDGKGRTWHCSCGWCESNKLFGVFRDQERMAQDFDYFFDNGKYVGEEETDNTVGD